MNSSESDDEVSSDIDDTILMIQADRETVSSVVPEKSRAVYEATYSHFNEWLKTEKIETINEEVLLAYFLRKSVVMKPSTLWSEYSKLRTTIYVNKNVDIKKFTNLIAFLKRESDGYVPKKPKMFTKNQIEKFLMEADDKEFLMMKVKQSFIYICLRVFISVHICLGCINNGSGRSVGQRRISKTF